MVDSAPMEERSPMLPSSSSWSAMMLIDGVCRRCIRVCHCGQSISSVGPTASRQEITIRNGAHLSPTTMDSPTFLCMGCFTIAETTICKSRDLLFVTR